VAQPPLWRYVEARGGASATGAGGHVAEPRESGSAQSAPSGVGLWGQPRQPAGPRAGEGQMADHNTVGRWIRSGW